MCQVKTILICAVLKKKTSASSGLLSIHDVVIMYDRFIAAVLTDKSSSIIQSQLNLRSIVIIKK